MRRRLVKQGRNALTVSLPAKWRKRHNLQPGDEIEVEEIDDRIILGGRGETPARKAVINAETTNERVLRWMLSGLHKGGWDEIEVMNIKSSTKEIIDDIVKNLYMGFAVVEQTDRRCLIKSISKELESEFDAILKRAFMATASMGESCIELIRKNRLKEMDGLISLEKTNNQLTNFCERILNKRGYHSYEKTCFVYVIAWNLEKVCDNYKYICEFLSENPSAKISEKVISLFDNANNQVRGYSSLFSKFDPDALIELNAKRKEILREIRNAMADSSSQENMVLNYLMVLVMNCEDFSTSMFMFNYSPDLMQ